MSRTLCSYILEHVFYFVNLSFNYFDNTFLTFACKHTEYIITEFYSVFHKIFLSVTVKYFLSSSSPHIFNLLSNPLHKLLEQINPANHKLFHKLIRLFQIFLEATVLLPQYLILIPQLYHLLLQIIISIDRTKQFLLKPFHLF